MLKLKIGSSINNQKNMFGILSAGSTKKEHPLQRVTSSHVSSSRRAVRYGRGCGQLDVSSGG